MTSYVPHHGSVKPNPRKPVTKPQPKGSLAGSYRPNVGFDQTNGIKITMSASAGVTDDGWLSTPFRFQCPPIGEFQRPKSSPWPTFATLSEGQRSRPEGAALEIWEFETLFVWDYERFVVWTGTDNASPNAANGVFEPQLFIEELKEIADQKIIFRLTAEDPNIWGSYALINSLATLTGVNPKEKPGEYGTEYVTLTFQQFREIELNPQSRKGKPRTAQQHLYLPKTTDTLSDIARRELGRPSAWQTIARANGISGVSATNAEALQLWMRAHHKTTLVIPAQTPAAKRPTTSASAITKAKARGGW